MRAKDAFDSAWPGVLGGLVAIAAALLFRTAADTRLLAEIVVDAATYALQARGFSFLLSLFGAAGKPLLFLAVLVGQLALYVLAWRAVSPRLGRRFGLPIGLVGGAALAAAVLVGASLALVGLPETGLGSRTTWAEYVSATLLASAAYALAAGLQASLSAASGPSGSRQRPSLTRRAFISRLPTLALGSAALFFIGRQLFKSAGGGVRLANAGRPTPEITPNRDFYIVSKNLIDPVVDRKGWRLRVGGLSLRHLELSYADILSLPARAQFTTLECISNEVGGYLMSNASWTGLPLRALIEMAGPSPRAAYVSFRCADDYSESLPLDSAMRDEVLLVYAMNGEPLPDKHGFPLRLLAPGKYGMKNPKWLTEIALLAEDSLGYWETRGWSNEAGVNSSSRIDVPATLDEITLVPFRLHGVAFAGNRGISRVEVSLDGGREWRDAVLRPALSPFTWVLWHYDWTEVPQDGRVIILARATDGGGEVQTAEISPPHPSGATGYPRVVATVRLAAPAVVGSGNGRQFP